MATLLLPVMIDWLHPSGVTNFDGVVGHVTLAHRTLGCWVVTIDVWLLLVLESDISTGLCT